MKTIHRVLELETTAEIDVHDLTLRLRQLLTDIGVRDGYMVISSRHTACAITVNENESRLIEDLKHFLARVVPKSDDYLHNDIEARGLPDEPQRPFAHRRHAARRSAGGAGRRWRAGARHLAAGVVGGARRSAAA